MLTALRELRFQLVTSEPLLQELAGVLARPRFARGLNVTAPKVEALLATLREQAELMTVSGTVHLCRDPDDDLIIETALNGRADALVTRDDDLKGEVELVSVLAGHGVAVLTVRRFLEVVEAPE